MADLSDQNSSQSVKIIAADSSNVEVGPVDYGSGTTSATTTPRTAANTYGIVQTSAPTAGTNATVKQLTADSYGRKGVSGTHALNAEWGQKFSVSTNTQALTGTTETPFLLFLNPNASGKTARIWRIIVGPTLGNNYVTYRFYIDATVTSNGTGLVRVGNRQTSQNAAVTTVFFAPTISANGTNLIRTVIASGLSGQSIPIPYDYSLWIEANHNLLITRQLSANTTIGGVDVEWAEQ